MNSTATAPPKTVVVLSGGMDSATLLYHLRQEGHELKAISFNYGQRHVKELEAARAIAESVEIEQREVDLRAITPLLGENSLSSRQIDVPEGHYEQENMKLTVVPNRNMILLSLAIGWAISVKFDGVAYGAHRGDHAIYPDCRPQFANALAEAARLCDWQPMELRRPFVQMDKGDIARRGVELEVPFELTWTCYKGQEKHCGRCGACTERREAFAKFNLPDPTDWEQATSPW